MSIACASCGYKDNPVGAEFCETCGAELTTPPGFADTEIYSHEVEDITPTPTIPQPVAPKPMFGTPKLVSKLPSYPDPEFILDGDSMLIGRFDPDSGPVEIDLEGFPGEETISRHHAEIYQEGGYWKIKDLGSTNGVFIKRANENRFSARILTPEILNPGDEVAIAKIRFTFVIKE